MMDALPNRMSLANVTTKASQRRLLQPRTVIYGVDGIGKSSYGAQAEKPIFIPTEDGATRIDVPQFPLCLSWGDVFDAMAELNTEHDYKTLVVDSVDWAQHLAIEHVIKEEFDGMADKFDAYGSGYKALLREFRKFMQWLDYLHKQRDMEIILIAHATVRTFRNPAGTDWDRYQSTLIDTPSTSIWGLVKEWADIVLFANYEVESKKATKTATKGKGISSGRRMCHASPSAAWDSKVRAGFNLPDSFELDYRIFRSELSSTDSSNTNIGKED